MVFENVLRYCEEAPAAGQTEAVQTERSDAACKARRDALHALGLTTEKREKLRAFVAAHKHTAEVLLADMGRGDTARLERAAADVNRHGLSVCATPGCGAVEPHVRFFKLCGSCKSTRYCSPACSAADWKRHKKECAGRKKE
jgi:hypothetical protein